VAHFAPADETWWNISALKEYRSNEYTPPANCVLKTNDPLISGGEANGGMGTTYFVSRE